MFADTYDIACRWLRTHGADPAEYVIITNQNSMVAMTMNRLREISSATFLYRSSIANSELWAVYGGVRCQVKDAVDMDLEEGIERV